MNRGGVPGAEAVEGERESGALKKIVMELVREEAEAMLREAKDAIPEMVRAEFLPLLRSAIRESISKELEEVASQSQPAMAKEAVKERVVTAGTAPSEDEPPITMEAAGGQWFGLYLYGIADASVQTKLGQIGIEEKEVYTIPYKELSAIVHDSPLEPYKSDNEVIVKGWIEAHQHVLDVAEEKFGTAIPFGFDRIVKPEDSKPAEEVLKNWIAEEYEHLKEKIEKIQGKREYGVQIFYVPSVVSEKITAESDELKRIREEMRAKGPGAAYLYNQKLESTLRREIESRAIAQFRVFFERIKRHVAEIKVEKTKGTDEKDKLMLMNLSCLVAHDRYKALGTELEEIDREEGFSVRFTGPWPAYSFV